MNGVFGALPDRRRNSGIQWVLAVVSGVLATDQILKWVLSDRAGVERTLDPILWQVVFAIAALSAATVALAFLLERDQISAPVMGLMVGGLASVTIDTFAGASFEFGLAIGSIADLAVAAGFVLGVASLLVSRVASNDPMIAHGEHRLAA